MREGFTQDEISTLHNEICKLVCAAFRVSRPALMQSRIRSASFARHIAIYLLRLQGISMRHVGTLFGGRSLSTVQHALAAIEDARDDDMLDATLDALEITLYRRMRARKTHLEDMRMVSKTVGAALPK